MNQSKISVRYSKALFSLALERNLLEEVRKDVELISKTWQETPELRDFYQSPVVKPSEKKIISKNIFGGKVNDITMSFVEIILLNKRESHINDIARNFVELVKHYKGITSAVLTTQFPVDDSIRKTIINLVKETYNKQVELVEKVDQNIIGGFILRVDDQQYDASVATKLRNIKKELTTTSIK